MVSSKAETLESELSHLKDTFCDKNDYPRRLVEEIIKNTRQSQKIKGMAKIGMLKLYKKNAISFIFYFLVHAFELESYINL